MPTADRRRFAPLAIENFLRQDYPNKELIILDDGQDTVADLVPSDPRVHYMCLSQKQTLGAKRNQCVQASHGDLIMHWDDDDWAAPHRIRYQVEALLQEKAEVCGLREMLFYDLSTSQTWLYSYPAGQRAWLAGGSLLYTRSFWQRAPFPNVQVGEDARFIWSQNQPKLAVLPDYRFYVAMIHPGNTSPKICTDRYWSRFPQDARQILGEAMDLYHSGQHSITLRQDEPSERKSMKLNLNSCDTPVAGVVSSSAGKAHVAYSILMVVHNACAMTQLTTLKTLRHIRGEDARLMVVDNGSKDGVDEWLKVLAQRGDIDLISNATNIGHGPALEQARQASNSRFIVTLDSDAFPLQDGWLQQLRERLAENIIVTGIRHHRDYIHPSCLMIERQTLDELRLTFLDEKDRPSQLDVAERISFEAKRRGYQIAGLEQTNAQRRGSVSEPVYLGAEYSNIVRHQWYTTRAAISGGLRVDDVPPEAIERSLQEVFEKYHSEPRELAVIIGIRAAEHDTDRLRNAKAALWALNLQDLERWRYRIILVEQDSKPRVGPVLAPLVDRYLFAHNSSAYNRGWAFNVGARLAGSSAALCLIDADLLPGPAFLRSALQRLANGQHALKPYEEIVYLDRASTDMAIRRRMAEPMSSFSADGYRGSVFKDSNGGCLFVEPRLYHDISGHDERFRGWGWEDRELWRRLEKRAPIDNLPGRLLHLDHVRPCMSDRWAMANAELDGQLAAGRIPPWSGPMGSLELYSGEEDIAKEVKNNNGRDWDNWHLWDDRRIDHIVTEEHRTPMNVSARWKLAQVIVTLGHTLLDAGCGPGAMWVHLEPHRKQMSWTGLDGTQKMLDAAHRRFPNVPVFRGDSSSLPFDAGDFELVLLRHVLEHQPVSLMERSLAEALRVASRAVLVDFYMPPAADKPRLTYRVGENFLETRWAVEDIEAPVNRAGWHIYARLNIQGTPGERDELWVLMPPKKMALLQEGSQELLRQAGPKISIIMPTYRRCHTILRTIQTICSQTYSNWELILVDNAGDGGYWFADPRIRVCRYSKQASASYARNEGLQHATGELVCFFDDDDDMFPNYLESFVNAFRENPALKMVRCGMLIPNTGTNFSHATPECCLRREYATPTWDNRDFSHDQHYFNRIVARNGWSEKNTDILVLQQALCRANMDPVGGLRSGGL